MKSFKTAVASALVLLSLMAAGCSATANRQEITENFVKKAFTIPDTQFAKSVQDLTTEDFSAKDGESIAVPTAEQSEKWQNLLKDFGGDVVSEKMLSFDSSFFQDVMMLHLIAGLHDYTCTVDKVSVKEVNKNKFSFQVLLTASYSSEPVKVIGAVTFNDKNLMEDMYIDSMSEYPPPAQSE